MVIRWSLRLPLLVGSLVFARLACHRAVGKGSVPRGWIVVLSAAAAVGFWDVVGRSESYPLWARLVFLLTLVLVLLSVFFYVRGYSAAERERQRRQPGEGA